jgi:CRP-like cAMP-binding protein
MLNIFQGMTTKEQESLRGFGVLRSLPQGEKIMNQGEQGKEVLILLQGQLKVQINKDKGYVVLALINPGNLVGETAWLEENLVRTADVVAGTDSLGLFYDRLALEKLCAQESRLAARFAFNLICLLADRLEAANEQLEHTTARAGV